MKVQHDAAYVALVCDIRREDLQGDRSADQRGLLGRVLRRFDTVGGHHRNAIGRHHLLGFILR